MPMKPEHIAGMLHCLKPILKDPVKGDQILTRYWRDKVAFVWTLQQIHRAANERSLAMTNAEAREILRKMSSEVDKLDGMSWWKLLDLIESNPKGRKLTTTELNRFINHDQITIARPD